ncbi:MAG: hypothetical protein KME25_21455 [Symplocastrum torsivum CPER-KK1]|uniref:Uncharacterized protein n=1 Tax=Symplocastrum torsivum CPER-KK1 TaxID=450513 RepID=A0A951PQK9_9CYAN|nr:hypothetical protein [Symplocastrum torsivum CPER-KK1]
MLETTLSVPLSLCLIPSDRTRQRSLIPTLNQKPRATTHALVKLEISGEHPLRLWTEQPPSCRPSVNINGRSVAIAPSITGKRD